MLKIRLEMSELIENIIELKDPQNNVHIVKHIGKLTQIEEIDASDYDKETFLIKYLRNNKPLVIRNALKKFDCGSAYQNWSLDYLNEKCGDNQVYVRRNTMQDGYKTGKAYQVQSITFKSYVSDLIQENERSKNSYLAVQNLRKAFPQIANELKMPDFVEKLHAGPFLWIARGGHYEYTHMDPDDNMLMVLRGQKLVRLYGCDIVSMKPNDLGSKGRTLQSQVNCFSIAQNINESDLARFKETECSYCLLNEGDLLYFPAFWWHQVTSPVQTISVNVFFGDAGDNFYVQKLLTSPQRSAFVYWLLNIVEQNRHYESFAKVLAQFRESLSSFLFKQWHESLSSEQIEVLYNEIVDYFKFDMEKYKLDESKTSKHPPQLKIRGLLWRNTDEDSKTNEDD